MEDYSDRYFLHALNEPQYLVEAAMLPDSRCIIQAAFLVPADQLLNPINQAFSREFIGMFICSLPWLRVPNHAFDGDGRFWKLSPFYLTLGS
ncbi:MAG TPA: hypothetical protein VIT23_07440 [Terrimicrobiaceae bacterium]